MSDGAKSEHRHHHQERDWKYVTSLNQVSGKLHSGKNSENKIPNTTHFPIVRTIFKIKIVSLRIHAAGDIGERETQTVKESNGHVARVLIVIFLVFVVVRREIRELIRDAHIASITGDARKAKT